MRYKEKTEILESINKAIKNSGDDSSAISKLFMIRKTLPTAIQDKLQQYVDIKNIQ